MANKDSRIDTYIAKSAPFAQPILKHIRSLVHTACPDVEETLKWGFPHFMHQGILCSMASFKSHCAFGFWKGSLILDSDPGDRNVPEKAMGQFGRIASLSDLPKDKVLLGYLKKAVQLNTTDSKSQAKSNSNSKSKSKQPEKKELKIPAAFIEALKKNKKAFAVFGQFSYSHKKEYVEWIGDAKTEETRKKRLATALEWMSEGKSRNWKYMKN